MRRRVPPDNTPKITLTNVLKRRKMNLAAYVKESGIASYGALLESCKRIGVIPPSEADYDKVAAEDVSIPTEGIVVMPAPPVIAESTGQTFEPEPDLQLEPAPILDPIEDDPLAAAEPTPRRRRRSTAEEPTA